MFKVAILFFFGKSNSLSLSLYQSDTSCVGDVFMWKL